MWPEVPNPPRLMDDLLPPVEVGDMPCGTTRVVVYLGGNVYNAGQSFHALYHRAHVRELVFFLPHLTSLDAGGTVKGHNANDLVEVMRSSTAKHTIVETECLGEDFEDSVRDALKRLTVAESQFDVDYDIVGEYTRTMSSWNRKSHGASAATLRERRNWAEDLHLPGLEEDPEVPVETMSLR